LAANKKKAKRLGAHIVFADESGFLMVPLVVKTWAPIGCTPRHSYRQSGREKLSVISAISVSPQKRRLGLYYQLFLDSIGQYDVRGFLRMLLRHLRGPVIVLLDNASMHRGKLLRQLPDQQPRLHLEYFPAYAPELNPDEGVWSLAKRSLANTCPLDLDELIQEVIDSIEQIRSSQTKLRGCIRHSTLPIFLR
jgi:transposase